MADISKASWDYFTLVANGSEPPSVETPVESARKKLLCRRLFPGTAEASVDAAARPFW